jgi:RimJ/RimL family protein N-acetyltransferase
MYRYEDVSIRTFREDDIQLKIDWINDPRVNQHLHYELPLEYEKTYKWFLNAIQNKNRFDGVIEYYGKPVGIVGVTNVDYEKKCAEDYLVIGDVSCWGKGIATKAGILNQLYVRDNMGLDYIYGIIEYDNISSLNQAIRRGAKFEELLPEYYVNKEKRKDAFRVNYHSHNIPTKALEGLIHD